MQLQEIKYDQHRVWVLDELSSIFSEDWFVANQTIGLPDSEKIAGRGGMQKFSVGKNHFILRHYYRGGVPAHFTKDRFLFRHWHATRAYKEINLLLDLLKDKFPVPKPVAARSVKHGVSYSSDIIMREIQDVKTLAQILTETSLTEVKWQELGGLIRKLHLYGYQHVDLNANNVLFDVQENFYLIDFDRCQRRLYSDSWAFAGLARLKRSLLKINQQQNLKINDKDLQCLSSAYAEWS